MDWKVPVRGIKPEEYDTLVEWLTEQQVKNMVDFGMLSYPKTTVLVAGNGNADLFMPLHPVLMLESLAARPGISGRNFIKCLRSLIASVKELAVKQGVAEIYFFIGDERVERLGHHVGFQKMDLPCYRLRLKLKGETDANI